MKNVETMKKLESYISVLAVRDLQESVSFFVDKLGFVLCDTYGDPMYVATVQRDDAQGISLLCMPDAKVGSNTIATLVFRCRDIDAIYQEFLANDVVMDGEIGDKEYGMREFSIKDPNGYIFFFQEKLEV